MHKFYSPAEDWTEFQDYHLTIHEQLQTIARNKRASVRAQHMFKTGMLEDGAATEVNMHYGRSEESESQLSHHEALLHWIELQRKILTAESSLPDDLDASDVSRGWATRELRQRRSKTRSVLGPCQTGVTKTKNDASRHNIGLRKHGSSVKMADPLRHTSSLLPGKSRQSPRYKDKNALRP